MPGGSGVADGPPRRGSTHRGHRTTSPAARTPHALWVRGPGALDETVARSVAVVGSRASTAYGEHVATDLASGLSDLGWTVVSGGAYGIDGAAHRASLAVGGRTVAVLAGGVDDAYPRGHAALLGTDHPRGARRQRASPARAPDAVPLPRTQPADRRPEPGHSRRRDGQAQRSRQHPVARRVAGATGHGRPGSGDQRHERGLPRPDPGPEGGARLRRRRRGAPRRSAR